MLPENTPKYWMTLITLAALLGSLAWMCQTFPGLWPPFAILSLAFLFSGMVDLTFWCWHRAAVLFEYTRRAAAVTPMALIIEDAAKLSPEQTTIVPLQMYRDLVGIVPGEEGPEKVLITAEGFIPLWFLVTFLSYDSSVNIYPENRTRDGTKENEYWRLTYDWLIWKNLVHPTREGRGKNLGPRSAYWVNKESRRRAAFDAGILDQIETLTE